MANFINFLSSHYIWLIIISLFLIFALIGYFVEQKNKKSIQFKIPSQKAAAEPNFENVQDKITKDVSLQDYVNNNASAKKNINNKED